MKEQENKKMREIKFRAWDKKRKNIQISQMDFICIPFSWT